MTTKHLIPRADGEGGIGKNGVAWGSGVFNTGRFQELKVNNLDVLTSVIQTDVTQHQTALSVTESQISDLKTYQEIEADGSVKFGDIATLSGDLEGRLVVKDKGILIGQAELKPDPDNPTSIYFNSIPQVEDSEGNVVTLLTADKLGLGTSSSLESSDQDIQFKLLTDERRFVVGTSGEYGLESGWYRFNDFNVKGATDIGAYSINPVDTRIYSDESSFILFTKDDFGNRVAHLVGGDEEVSPNNNIAIGLAIKVDSEDSPSDIEFVHTDGESYSVINGDSDSKGTNNLPIRQGFQTPSIGANPSPLLIDGGYF